VESMCRAVESTGDEIRVNPPVLHTLPRVPHSETAVMHTYPQVIHIVGNLDLDRLSTAL